MDQDSLKFLDSLVENSVLRKLGHLKKYAVIANDALGFLLDMGAWNNSQLLFIAFMWYEYIVYNFQLYMIPLSLLFYVVFRLISAQAVNELNQVVAGPEISIGHVLINLPPAPVPVPIVPVPNGQTTHPLYKLQALVELVQVIQTILPVFKNVHAQLSRLAELVHFDLMSWTGCKVLLAVTLWVYFIGLRYLLMAAGVYGFVKVHPASAKLKLLVLHAVIKLKLVDYLPNGRIKESIKSAIDELRTSQHGSSEIHSLLADTLIATMSGCSPPETSISDVVSASVPTIYLDPSEFMKSASLSSDPESTLPLDSVVPPPMPALPNAELPSLRHRIIRI